MGNNEGGFRWGSLAVLVGAAFILVGVADRATTEPIDIQVVQLHNDEAQTGSGCESRGPSWHFVLAPNNGTFAFHSISLMVSGALYQFDAGDLIRNSGQRDNVFVRVPDGRTVGDLQAAGSFAEVTPGSSAGSVRFVLSDVCAGGGSTTTTTTSTSSSVPHSTTSTSTSVPHSTTSTSTSVPHSTTSTSTSVPESTSTTSTSVPESTSTTSTSVPESTSTTSTSVPVGATTTTTAPSSTTSTSVEQGVPTTTSTSTTTTTTTASTSTSTTTVPKASTTSPATTTTVVRQSAPTGSGAARPLLMIGAMLVILGASALLGAHVRSTEPR